MVGVLHGLFQITHPVLFMPPPVISALQVLSICLAGIFTLICLLKNAQSYLPRKMLYYFHKSEFDKWLPYFSRALIVSCWNNRYASLYHLKSSYTASTLCCESLRNSAASQLKRPIPLGGYFTDQNSPSWSPSSVEGWSWIWIQPSTSGCLGLFNSIACQIYVFLNPKTLWKIKVYLGVQYKKQIKAEILWLRWAKESRVCVCMWGITSLPQKSSS